MSEFAALALYPLWAVTVLLGVTALRLGRDTSPGLVSLCFLLACWVTTLVLFEHPATTVMAERLIPMGMLLAGGFVHAAADIVGASRRPMLAAYLWGAAIAVMGAIDPALLYSRGLAAPGPLFWPVVVVSVAGAAAVVAWGFAASRSQTGLPARRRRAVGLGALFASLGGAGVAAEVLGVGDINASAPPLLVAVACVAYAVLSGETGRARRLVKQGLVYAAMTAALSSVGLVVYFRILPELAPGAGRSFAWAVIVTFFAALPLDALRNLLVETLGRRLFVDPIGVRDLADEVDRTATRADHAERLAEIGRVAGAVAHELRNPLGVITAQATLLERRGARAESIAALRDQVERARRFIDDLLRYGSPRPLEIETVRVVAAARRAVATVSQVYGGDRSPIDVAIASDLEVEADPAALHDVLAIVLGNSFAALAAGTGDGVELGARGEPGAVIIEIEDDGPGVPAAIEAELFEPFVTGRGRDAAHPGTGLGLAIARRLVERHGGSIHHERPPAGGARFVIRWPRRAAV